MSISSRTLSPVQTLLLVALLAPACASETPAPGGGGDPAAPSDPAPEDPKPADPTPPGGCLKCTQPEPQAPQEPPVTAAAEIGRVTLSHLQMSLLGQANTTWTVDVRLDGVAAPQATTIGACRRVATPAPGPALDAGELTVGGGVYQPLRMAIDADSKQYWMVDDEDDASDGTLFREASQLKIAAAGGKDLQALTMDGAWTGVKLLEYRAPQTLNALPAGELRLSWTAAPKADTRMEVSLRSPDSRIDCPVSSDTGEFSVPKEVLAAVPSGPVYVIVSRVATAQAKTTPDKGVVRLESRSSWQIITRK